MKSPVLVLVVSAVSLVALAYQTVSAQAQDSAAISRELPSPCQTAASKSIDTGTIGVVLMHGKRGTPRGSIRKLGDYLKRQGFKVQTPEMPWSKSRHYDRTFEEAMEEIDHAVERLRNNGATHIAVGGQSQGSTASLGYGARRSGLAGIIVIAGGGDPYQLYQWKKKKFGASVEKARQMVAAGKGDERAKFADAKKGRVVTARTTARIYLSYFDPKGPAFMPRNAAELQGGAPLLWIYGRDDPLRKTNDPDYAFAKAPTNPLNAYVVIVSGHLDAPEKGRQVVGRWLRCLVE